MYFHSEGRLWNTKLLVLSMVLEWLDKIQTVFGKTLWGWVIVSKGLIKVGCSFFSRWWWATGKTFLLSFLSLFPQVPSISFLPLPHFSFPQFPSASACIGQVQWWVLGWCNSQILPCYSGSGAFHPRLLPPLVVLSLKFPTSLNLKGEASSRVAWLVNQCFTMWKSFLKDSRSP